MRVLTALPLVVCMSLISVACFDTGRSPLPEKVARALKTPDGSEVFIVCPPSMSALLETADPGKVATALAEFDINNPQPPEGLFQPGALTPAPNSLLSVIPTNSSLGPMQYFGEETNRDFGGDMWSGFASEVQLDQMGRLCGVEEEGGLQLRVDLYAATPGAKESYHREARWLDDDAKKLNTGDAALLSSIGDERRLAKGSWSVKGPDGNFAGDEYDLMFRRRNIIVRASFQYGSSTQSGFGPPTPLLEYAWQLDQNIEAAAQQ